MHLIIQMKNGMKNFLFLFMAVAMFSCTPKQEQAIGPQPSKSAVVYDNIMSRRSIRAYKPEQVSKAQLDTIMQSAINAPSARNLQSWEVRVIQSSEMLAKIREINANFAYGAPTVIVIAKDKANAFSDVDCGIMAQNIQLMAEAMNLGTCVLGKMSGIPEKPEAKDIMAALEIPETHEVTFAIALGHKDQSPEAKPRNADKVKYIN